ncbi:MAG: GNAT family N-acetyltransferase [Solirubrobacterales bacterium]
MITLLLAQAGDLETILALQQLAYQSEAEIYQDSAIHPLRETLDELRVFHAENKVLKAVADGRIVGSVRGREADGTCYVGRLIVDPEYQNQGIGKALLKQIETEFPGCRYELFTGHKSDKNLALYQKMGYSPFRTEPVHERLSLVYLEKQPAALPD